MDKKISEATAYYIEALELLLKTEEAFIKGYTALYGRSGDDAELERMHNDFLDLKTQVKISLGNSVEFNIAHKNGRV